MRVDGLQIMASMTKYARKALVDRYDAAVRIKTPVYPSVPGAPQSSLSLMLAHVLDTLYRRERIQGIQVRSSASIAFTNRVSALFPLVSRG